MEPPSISGLISHIQQNVALISTKITTLMQTHTELHAAHAQEHATAIDKLTHDSTAAETAFDEKLLSINKQLADKTTSSDEIIAALKTKLVELGTESANVEKTNANEKAALNARIKDLEDAATATAASLTEIDNQTVAVLNIFGSGSGDGHDSSMDKINDENAAKFNEQNISQSSPSRLSVSRLDKNGDPRPSLKPNGGDLKPLSSRQGGRRRSRKNKKSKSRKSRKYRK